MCFFFVSNRLRSQDIAVPADQSGVDLLTLKTELHKEICSTILFWILMEQS